MADSDTIQIIWHNKGHQSGIKTDCFLDTTTKASLQKNYPTKENQTVMLVIKKQNWDGACGNITFYYHDANQKTNYTETVPDMEFRGRYDHYIHYDLKSHKVIDVKNDHQG